jgi:hypothetical protein
MDAAGKIKEEKMYDISATLNFFDLRKSYMKKENMA